MDVLKPATLRALPLFGPHHPVTDKPTVGEPDGKAAVRLRLGRWLAAAPSSNGMAAETKAELKQRFGVDAVDLAPRVCYRITDNWLGLTVRFLVGTHRIRNVKDAMSRQSITEPNAAGIAIASSTTDIVGFPVHLEGPRP